MLKVLIVDDEKMPRDILVNYIHWKTLGVSSVEEADDGIEAMNRALKMEPDIIISDIKMPKMDGIQLAGKIREHLPECKFIFLSGYSDKEYLKSAIKLKAVSYVEKPINLEEITEILKVAVSECFQEKKIREESLELTEQRLCLELISSTCTADTIKEKLVLIAKNFAPHSKCITVVVKFNLEDYPDMRKKAISLLKLSLTQVSSKYVMGIKGEDFCVFHFKIEGHNFVNGLKETFEAFISEAKQNFGEACRLFIGFGQIADSPYKQRHSYQTAIISIQKHFFRGYNKCILYSDDHGQVYQFNEAFLNSMDEYIKAEKECETEVLIKRLFNDIKKYENTSPDNIRSIFYKIILCLSRLAEDRNISIFEANIKIVLQAISEANTLDEIEAAVIRLISTIFRHLSSIGDNSTDILTRITRYININFSDENLSINSIAENLGLTPTYLCMVFKRDTGKTINQYITSQRVEKSKEYLQSLDIKLYDVARRVGYSDGKYFTKVFSKTVGISPKEYREIHCRDKKSI